MEVLAVILFIAVIVLLYLFFTLKAKENSLRLEFELCKNDYKTKEKSLRQEFDLSKSEHKFALSELEKRMNAEITNQAGAKFQEWRNNECEKDSVTTISYC